MLSPPKSTSYGKKNGYIIGRKSRFDHSNIIFYGENCKLIIGENCNIKNTKFHFEGKGSTIIIGNHITIESCEIASVGGKTIRIGNDCMISSNVHIVTTDSHSIINEMGNRLNAEDDVEIGNHVWIGQGVIVNKGVKIGDNTIIGAKSIVTHSVKNNTCVAGIPAKLIKSNVNWLRERI